MANVEQKWAAPSPRNARRRWLLTALCFGGLLLGLVLSSTAAMMWRSSVRSHERQSFESSADDVTQNLGTLLRRDVDFVATLRGVATMQPNLSPTGFDTWYATLDGSQRQVGSIGSAIVSRVPADQLAAFEARRDADPAIRKLLGHWLVPIKQGPEQTYCLLSAGGKLLPLTSFTAPLVQEDWCSPTTVTGISQGPLLREETTSGQVLVEPLDLPTLKTVFFESAFYRRGVPLNTPAEREAAVDGWLASSFDMKKVIDYAIGGNHELSVSLYHRNPGSSYELVDVDGAVRHPSMSRHSLLSIDGAWAVTVAGNPVVAGPGAEAQGRIVFAVGMVISLLLLAFVLMLGRSRERALRMVAQKTVELRHLAMHDPLTGLPNRRALVADLSEQLASASPEAEVMLALFDLNGFKEYNDTFGHPSGDALLARVGERLAAAVAGTGVAYRVGGDEFCVLAPADTLEAAALAQDALSERGEAFTIGCSFGVARLPTDAASAADAFRVADDRMYEHKATSRVGAGRQSTDVLLRALAERNSELTDHLDMVAMLAEQTAERLGLDEATVNRTRIAAELHDVGKVAIPDSIIDKPGPLTDEEWQFMRRHTEIGERIVRAAPSLEHAAHLVRSSHERHDGRGYPDKLAGDTIPLGARIIAVCDAFDAMISARPYSVAMTSKEAVAELRRCAGTQFDPEVVAAFCDLIEKPRTTTSARDRVGAVKS